MHKLSFKAKYAAIFLPECRVRNIRNMNMNEIISTFAFVLHATNMHTSFTAPIDKEFREFESLYKQALSADNTTLSKMFDLLYSSTGKQMRPALVLLSAKICGGISKASINAAIAVELLHLASLVHDDVVDEADMRRGKPSINSCFDNKLAILGGDYILSSALDVASQTGNMRVIRVITLLGKDLCEGEVMQYNNAKQRIFNENAYYGVIGKKTAALFSACAELGCITAEKPDSHMTGIMKEFGRIVGICFQIKDDIFDYSPKADTGKPNGKDLDEGKATLPLIHIFTHTDESGKKKLLEAISAKDVPYLQQCALEQGGLEYAMSKMDELRKKALEIIAPVGDIAVKSALENYISYIVEREK